MTVLLCGSSQTHLGTSMPSGGGHIIKAEEERSLTSSELLKFYSNDTAFEREIGGKKWVFAAFVEIEPTGDCAIESQPVDFVYEDEWFQLDDEINWLTLERLKALNAADKSDDLFDGDPFRIKSIRKVNGRKVVKVARCKYFDSLRTSFALDNILPKSVKNHAEQGRSLREILHKENASIGDINKSRLSNHMGLVVIVESKDGQIMYQRRSSKVQIRPNTLSSSVSGTFEKNDLVHATRETSMADAVQGVVREMHGELGGKYHMDQSNLYFLGLMREFRRGGFPDFYFYYQSELTSDEIRENAKTAEETFEIDSIEGYYVGSRAFLEDCGRERKAFDKRVCKLLEKIDGQANLTLSLGVALFHEMAYKRCNAAKLSLD